MHLSVKNLLSFFILLGLHFCVGAADLSTLELEQLLVTEVVSADKITQQISDAPSAVSVITAQDIQDYGYRNLADILDGMRGLYSYRFNGFTMLGGRGISGGSSLSGRLMLLVDGQNVGENFFNRVLIGDDSLIDVHVIERVEYIPGAGSIRYGNSAFLGTINIITKKGVDALGTQFALGVGTGQDDAQRVTFGTKLLNGADVLVSASRLGGRQFDRAFLTSSSASGPFTNTTIDSTELAHNQRLFAKLSLENTTATLAYTASGANLQTLGTSGNTITGIRNDSAYVSLEHHQSLFPALKSYSHVYYGQYLFNLDEQHSNTVASGPFGSNRFTTASQTRWFGLDQEFVYTPNHQHQVLAGFSLRDDYRADFAQNNNMDFSAPKKTYSVYMHDQYQILPHVALIYGGRLDRVLQDTFFVPRLAAIWAMSPFNTLKLSRGRNLRFANGFDQINTSNTALSPETLDATEIVLESKLDNRSRLLASVYHYDVDDIIQSPYIEGVSDRIFGQELELEHVWENSTRLRSSIAHQHSRSDSTVSADYRPAYLSKLNLSWPILQSRVRMAVDVRYNSHYTVNQQAFGGNVITNLTFNVHEVLPHTSMRLNIRNLLNADNATSESSPIFDRSFWLQFEYNYL